MRIKFIALAIVACGAAAPLAAQPVIQAVPERPRLIVDSYGEVKTPPDLAVISYTIRGEGSTSDDAVRSLTATGSRIEAALRKIDRATEPRTGEVKVTPVKSDACKEEEYSAPQLSSGPCAVLGYVATQTMTVRTAAVTDAGTMVGLVGRGGGFSARISSFELRDPRVAQGQATAAALSDAASKASAIAAASRVPLGGILSINSAARQVGEQLVVSGLRRPAAEMDLAEPAPPPVPVKVNPEPMTTSSSVTVTYAIGH